MKYQVKICKKIRFTFFSRMQDNTPQVIYMKNNKFDFFNQRGDYKNLTEYKIMEN